MSDGPRQREAAGDRQAFVSETAAAAIKAPPLFLPGHLCDGDIWAAQASALADLQPVVVSGYGLANSLVRMAEIALALAPPRFSLVGHSMGARVALEIVRLAPGRVARVALLDTGVHLPRPGERESRFALLELGRRGGVESLVDAWLPPMVHPDRRGDAAFMAPLRAMSIGQGLAAYEAQVEALLARPDAIPVLDALRCPVLVGVGRQDEWSTVSQHEFIISRIPQARLVVFENSGHMAPVEAPDQVNRALREWMTLAPAEAATEGAI